MLLKEYAILKSDERMLILLMIKDCVMNIIAFVIILN